MNQAEMDLQTIATVRAAMTTVVARACGIGREDAEKLYLRAYNLIRFDHSPCLTNQVAIVLHTFQSIPGFEGWFIPCISLCQTDEEVSRVCRLMWGG